MDTIEILGLVLWHKSQSKGKKSVQVGSALLEKEVKNAKPGQVTEDKRS